MTKHENKSEADAAPAPVVLTPEQIEALQTEAAKAADHWNNYVRAVADLDNYKKRAARERSDASAYANQSLLQKLLPVLDNFEMAQAAAQTSGDVAAQSLQSGVAMILTQLKTTLAEAGLEEIEALGKPFDPNFHEAISEQESAEVPDHHVLIQLRRGYKLRERLLRPATVVVAKAPAK
jgi:molecular chaperone GrpE